MTHRDFFLKCCFVGKLAVCVMRLCGFAEYRVASSRFAIIYQTFLFYRRSDWCVLDGCWSKNLLTICLLCMDCQVWMKFSSNWLRIFQTLIWNNLLFILPRIILTFIPVGVSIIPSLNVIRRGRLASRLKIAMISAKAAFNIKKCHPNSQT